MSTSNVRIVSTSVPRRSRRYGTALPVFYAGPGLIYIPTPSSEGTLTLEFGRTWIDYGVWVLVLLGLLICLMGRKRSDPSRHD